MNVNDYVSDKGKMLDLGCGRKKFHPKAVGVDSHKMEGVDVTTDLDSPPYPFKSESFDFIYMSSILEHLHDTIKVMEEVHRILKPGGRVLIRIPHFSGQSAYCNPQHIRFFSTDSFNCFEKGNPEYSKINFMIEKKELHWSAISTKGRRKTITELLNHIFSFLANVNIHLCERYWVYWVGGFEEMEVLLRKE